MVCVVVWHVQLGKQVFQVPDSLAFTVLGPLHATRYENGLDQQSIVTALLGLPAHKLPRPPQGWKSAPTNVLRSRRTPSLDEKTQYYTQRKFRTAHLSSTFCLSSAPYSAPVVGTAFAKFCEKLWSSPACSNPFHLGRDKQDRTERGVVASVRF